MGGELSLLDPIKEWGAVGLIALLSLLVGLVAGANYGPVRERCFAETKEVDVGRVYLHEVPCDRLFKGYVVR
jgi:hypothetical protein